MKPSKLSTANLAKQLNVSSKTISDIINNRARITLDLAVKLSTVLEPKPDFWLNIQPITTSGMQPMETAALTIPFIPSCKSAAMQF
jgi:addiction module HigA family antidote